MGTQVGAEAAAGAGAQGEHAQTLPAGLGFSGALTLGSGKQIVLQAACLPSCLLGQKGSNRL